MEFDIKGSKGDSYLDYESGSTTNRRSSKKAKVSKILERFHQMYEAASSWRDHKKKYEDFYDGNQLTEEERQELRARSQPDVVINRIKTQVDLIKGLHQRFRQRIKVFNRNESEQDFQTAEAMSHALRFVDQTNSVEFTDQEVFDDGVIGGRGWFHTFVEMNDEFEPDIKIDWVDNDDIVLDPQCRRYDLADAKDLAHTVWHDIDDLIAMFPKKERVIRRACAAYLDTRLDDNPYQKHNNSEADQYLAALYSDQKTRDLYFDRDRRRLRVINYWYRKREKRKILMHPDLGVAMLGTNVSQKDIEKSLQEIQDKSGFVPELFEKMVEVVRVSTIIGGEELEEKESPFLHGQFPYTQYLCFKEKSSGEPYGLIKQAIDPQTEVNKRRSKALHLLNEKLIIADEGAVEDKEVARSESARPDGYIETQRGLKFEIKSGQDLGTAQLQLYQAAIKEIDDVTGINRDLQGQATNARSGKAIDLRQQQGLAVLSTVFENWKRTKLLVAKQIVSLIQQFWTDEKAIRVTDDQNVVKFLRLNQTIIVNGKPQMLRNVSSGKYDLVFDESDDSVNLGEDIFGELAKLSQTGVLPPDILMEFAPIPFALKQRILSMLRPQQTQTGAAPGGEQAQPSEAEMMAMLGAETSAPPAV